MKSINIFDNVPSPTSRTSGERVLVTRALAHAIGEQEISSPYSTQYASDFEELSHDGEQTESEDSSFLLLQQQSEGELCDMQPISLKSLSQSLGSVESFVQMNTPDVHGVEAASALDDNNPGYLASYTVDHVVEVHSTAMKDNVLEDDGQGQNVESERDVVASKMLETDEQLPLFNNLHHLIGAAITENLPKQLSVIEAESDMNKRAEDAEAISADVYLKEDMDVPAQGIYLQQPSSIVLNQMRRPQDFSVSFLPAGGSFGACPPVDVSFPDVDNDDSSEPEEVQDEDIPDGGAYTSRSTNYALVWGLREKISPRTDAISTEEALKLVLMSSVPIPGGSSFIMGGSDGDSGGNTEAETGASSHDGEGGTEAPPGLSPNMDGCFVSMGGSGGNTGSEIRGSTPGEGEWANEAFWGLAATVDGLCGGNGECTGAGMEASALSEGKGGAEGQGESKVAHGLLPSADAVATLVLPGRGTDRKEWSGVADVSFEALAQEGKDIKDGTHLFTGSALDLSLNYMHFSGEVPLLDKARDAINFLETAVIYPHPSETADLMYPMFDKPPSDQRSRSNVAQIHDEPGFMDGAWEVLSRPGGSETPSSPLQVLDQGVRPFGGAQEGDAMGSGEEGQEPSEESPRTVDEASAVLMALEADAFPLKPHTYNGEGASELSNINPPPPGVDQSALRKEGSPLATEFLGDGPIDLHHYDDLGSGMRDLHSLGPMPAESATQINIDVESDAPHADPNNLDLQEHTACPFYADKIAPLQAVGDEPEGKTYQLEEMAGRYLGEHSMAPVSPALPAAEQSPSKVGVLPANYASEYEAIFAAYNTDVPEYYGADVREDFDMFGLTVLPGSESADELASSSIKQTILEDVQSGGAQIPEEVDVSGPELSPSTRKEGDVSGNTLRQSDYEGEQSGEMQSGDVLEGPVIVTAVGREVNAIIGDLQYNEVTVTVEETFTTQPLAAVNLAATVLEEESLSFGVEADNGEIFSALHGALANDGGVVLSTSHDVRAHNREDVLAAVYDASEHNKGEIVSRAYDAPVHHNSETIPTAYDASGRIDDEPMSAAHHALEHYGGDVTSMAYDAEGYNNQAYDGLDYYSGEVMSTMYDAPEHVGGEVISTVYESVEHGGGEVISMAYDSPEGRYDEVSSKVYIAPEHQDGELLSTAYDASAQDVAEVFPADPNALVKDNGDIFSIGFDVSEQHNDELVSASYDPLDHRNDNFVPTMHDGSGQGNGSVFSTACDLPEQNNADFVSATRRALEHHDGELVSRMYDASAGDTMEFFSIANTASAHDDVDIMFPAYDAPEQHDDEVMLSMNDASVHSAHTLPEAQDAEGYDNEAISHAHADLLPEISESPCINEPPEYFRSGNSQVYLESSMDQYANLAGKSTVTDFAIEVLEHSRPQFDDMAWEPSVAQQSAEPLESSEVYSATEHGESSVVQHGEMSWESSRAHLSTETSQFASAEYSEVSWESPAAHYSAATPEFLAPDYADVPLEPFEADYTLEPLESLTASYGSIPITGAATTHYAIEPLETSMAESAADKVEYTVVYDNATFVESPTASYADDPWETSEAKYVVEPFPSESAKLSTGSPEPEYAVTHKEALSTCGVETYGKMESYANAGVYSSVEGPEKSITSLSVVAEGEAGMAAAVELATAVPSFSEPVEAAAPVAGEVEDEEAAEWSVFEPMEVAAEVAMTTAVDEGAAVEPSVSEVIVTPAAVVSATLDAAEVLLASGSLVDATATETAAVVSDAASAGLCTLAATIEHSSPETESTSRLYLTAESEVASSAYHDAKPSPLSLPDSENAECSILAEPSMTSPYMNESMAEVTNEGCTAFVEPAYEPDIPSRHSPSSALESSVSYMSSAYSTSTQDPLEPTAEALSPTIPAAVPTPESQTLPGPRPLPPTPTTSPTTQMQTLPGLVIITSSPAAAPSPRSPTNLGPKPNFSPTEATSTRVLAPQRSLLWQRNMPPPPPSPFPGMLYLEGRDSCGRPVVVVNTAKLPAHSHRKEALEYITKVLLPIVEKGRYVLVLASAVAGPRISTMSALWCASAYQRLAKPFRKNVAHIVLVQPSAWVRAALAIVRPLTSRKAERKVRIVNSFLEMEAATGGEVRIEQLGARFLYDIVHQTNNNSPRTPHSRPHVVPATEARDAAQPPSSNLGIPVAPVK